MVDQIVRLQMMTLNTRIVDLSPVQLMEAGELGGHGGAVPLTVALEELNTEHVTVTTLNPSMMVMIVQEIIPTDLLVIPQWIVEVSTLLLVKTHGKVLMPLLPQGFLALQWTGIQQQLTIKVLVHIQRHWKIMVMLGGR